MRKDEKELIFRDDSRVADEGTNSFVIPF